ncbi:hypothetical protein C8R44DRAFT_775759 [Mycena epipterygia]|nr:hypothetical protein C8R44DRAFT_823768 [Mycena epipterygia]KAJ7130554.1 hypothetical protein C8R44DRAFT_775759 [Mycena epipterygia]
MSQFYSFLNQFIITPCAEGSYVVMYLYCMLCHRPQRNQSLPMNAKICNLEYVHF